MSKISPVQQNSLLRRQNADLEAALGEAALQIHKLKQEVTGGLQVIHLLASKFPERRFTLNADDLITSMGSVRRVHNREENSYTFIALTRQEVLREKLEKVNAQRVEKGLEALDTEALIAEAERRFLESLTAGEKVVADETPISRQVFENAELCAQCKERPQYDGATDLCRECDTKHAPHLAIVKEEASNV
jgi:hypothetical protein